MIIRSDKRKEIVFVYKERKSIAVHSPFGVANNMKEGFHKFMNIFLPVISIISAVFILPPFLLFKLLYTLLKRTSFIEDVAGKVVVITGASSGLGEVIYDYLIQANIRMLLSFFLDKYSVNLLNFDFLFIF